MKIWKRVPQPCDNGGGHYFDGEFEISDSVHFVADPSDIQNIIQDIRRYARRTVGGVDYVQVYEHLEGDGRIVLIDKTSKADLEDLRSHPNYSEEDAKKYHRVDMTLEAERFLSK